MSIAKVRRFFDVGIMPELLGRWFSLPPKQSTVTQPPLDPNSPHSDADEEPSTSTPDLVKYRYCQGDEYGDMVCCASGSTWSVCT